MTFAVAGHVLALPPMGDWPLVGRVEEMRLVADALGDAADGVDGAGIVIAGQAGVGKSRLAREAVAVAEQRGWLVRSVAGTAAAQGVPLGAFAQWIDQIDANPVNVVAAGLAAITEAPNGTPVLVAVDDAQLLDEMSAFVLHQLVRRRAAVVIATIRSGQSAPETITSLWKDGHLRRLDLQPLSRPQSDTLLETVLDGSLSPDSAARMWDLTRGNVLFLRELVRQERQAGRLGIGAGTWRWTGEMNASPTLVDLVDLYIGAAPEPALEVLDLVAVAEPLDFAHLRALADADAIEDAERRQLISVSDTSANGVVRVAHPLYGEARRARTGPVRAARLRGRVASAMHPAATAAGARPYDPVRLALLWVDSDLPGDPAVFLRGAQAAFLRLDLALTHRLADAAVAAGAGIEAHALLAISLARLGKADAAEEILDAITTDPQGSGLSLGWLAATIRAANMLFTRCLPAQSWSVLEKALAAAAAGERPSLLAFRVVQLAFAARPAEAAALAESIDRRQLTPMPGTILACGTVLATGDLGRLEAATAAADEGTRLAAASPQAAFQAVGLNLLYADALVMAGQIREALALAGHVYQQWADIPRIPTTVATAINGMAALAHGDVRTAHERLRAAINENEFRQDTSGLAYMLWVPYSEALARAGLVDAATDALETTRHISHPSYVYLESAQLRAAAWVAAARGHSSEALALARQAADVARGHGQFAREVMCLQTALQFGDQQGVQRLTELAGLVEGPRAALVARWAGALADGDGDALLEISAELEKMGDRIAAADAAAQAAPIFERHARRGARLTACGCASRLVTDCAATTPATLAVAAPLPLSSREREIALLVSEGLSNRQIADALTMSVRTVEGHIYRACNKLGTSTRTELGRLVAQFAPASLSRH